MSFYSYIREQEEEAMIADMSKTKLDVISEIRDNEDLTVDQFEAFISENDDIERDFAYSILFDLARKPAKGEPVVGDDEDELDNIRYGVTDDEEDEDEDGVMESFMLDETPSKKKERSSVITESVLVKSQKAFRNL